MSTYVYIETEVKLTGRTAVRTSARKTDTLYEITPAHDDGPRWKKWVRMNELYQIQQSKTILFDAEAIRQAQKENNEDDIS